MSGEGTALHLLLMDISIDMSGCQQAISPWYASPALLAGDLKFMKPHRTFMFCS